MKINLIGMILNNSGRRVYEGAVINDDGRPLSAADSLDAMIMEYAKLRNGGTSDLVVLSREVARTLPYTPTSEARSECPYCNRPADSNGGINHLGGCAGLQEVRLNRLQYDALVSATDMRPAKNTGESR